MIARFIWNVGGSPTIRLIENGQGIDCAVYHFKGTTVVKVPDELRDGAMDSAKEIWEAMRTTYPCTKNICISSRN